MGVNLVGIKLVGIRTRLRKPGRGMQRPGGGEAHSVILYLSVATLKGHSRVPSWTNSSALTQVRFLMMSQFPRENNNSSDEGSWASQHDGPIHWLLKTRSSALGKPRIPDMPEQWN